MSILCTMPGRHGDILWALPTVRALAEQQDGPVDFLVSQKYGSLVNLIQRQTYIRSCAADASWDVRETAPMTPRVPQVDLGAHDHVFHLGYEGWPQEDLPQDIARRAGVTIDLTRPWITAPYPIEPSDVCIGFTDEHFELKLGLYDLLMDRFYTSREEEASCKLVSLSNGPRWDTEGRWRTVSPAWETSAAWLSQTKVFVGCCSALHVLAVAMGKAVICVEPNPQRHQDVFYPLGKVGQVQLLLGGDGLPTVDARHLGDAVQRRLKGEAR